MKKYKLAVIWFSYLKDEQLVYESVKCFQNTVKNITDFDIDFFVINDSNNSISNNYLIKLSKELNVKLVNTKYDRHGNLKGMINLINQINIFKQIGKNYDLVIKIDSDTMFLNFDWIDTFAKDENPIMTGAYLKRSYDTLIGSCYAIKTKYGDIETFNFLLNDCIKYPVLFTQCFDDYEINMRLFRLFNADQKYCIKYKCGFDGFVPLTEGDRDGFWVCDPFKVSKDYLNGRVITIGNDITFKKITDKNKKDTYKILQFKMMEKINKDLNI